jgi:hypothetical protein
LGQPSGGSNPLFRTIRLACLASRAAGSLLAGPANGALSERNESKAIQHNPFKTLQTMASSGDIRLHPSLRRQKSLRRAHQRSCGAKAGPRPRDGVEPHGEATAARNGLHRPCGSLAEAVNRERQLKRWSGAKKEALIAGDTRALQALSRRRRKHLPAHA